MWWSFQLGLALLPEIYAIYVDLLELPRALPVPKLEVLGIFWEGWERKERGFLLPSDGLQRVQFFAGCRRHASHWLMSVCVVFFFLLVFFVVD